MAAGATGEARGGCGRCRDSYLILTRGSIHYKCFPDFSVNLSRVQDFHVGVRIRPGISPGCIRPGISPGAPGRNKPAPRCAGNYKRVSVCVRRV